MERSADSADAHGVRSKLADQWQSVVRVVLALVAIILSLVAIIIQL